MDTLDWEDIWTRLKGMLWSAAALGLAGLCAGGWIYGLELRNAQLYQPEFYREFYNPSLLGEGVQLFAGWIRGAHLRETVMNLLWFAGVLWVYLIPEARGRRRLVAVLSGLAGLVAAFWVDKTTGRWGEGDLWVRFGVLLGCGTFLGIGLAFGERGKVLLGRIIRGGLSGGYIGLVCVFAAEIELMGYVSGMSPGIRTALIPAVCGAVIGLTLRGGELLFAGLVTEQWRRYWPLILMALVVLINAIGPVLLVQHWFTSGQL